MYHKNMENRHGSSRYSSRSPVAPRDKVTKNPLIEISSIMVFALSIFMLCALTTYSPNDPSMFSNSKAIAQNACGPAGAFLAAILLQWFGMGSFVVPAALLFISATIHRREGTHRVIGTLAGMTVAVIALTVFLTLQWKYWPFSGTLLLTGGAFGAWISELLVRQFNPLGSSIVSLVFFFAALAISTPVSVAKFGALVISVSLRTSWKLLSIVGTYLFYLLGLLAMRSAHAIGDLVQSLIESAVRRAKERAKMAKVVALSTSSAAEPEPKLAELTPNAATESPITATQVYMSDNLPQLPSEAPNALPELEPAEQLQLKLTSEPKILPRESTSPEETDETEHGDTRKATAMAKAAARLARAARAKRGQWKLPAIEFLRKPPRIESSVDRDKLITNSLVLKQKFADFGIEGEVEAVRPGPVITLYEFKPGPGIKVSRIAALADDLSMALSAQSVRILAPLPGKSVVGIEIPSDQRETVYLREFLQNSDFYGSRHAIPVAMGKDIGGQTYISDLARMPHLLCAGQTGSGKSVFMNGLICSLLYRFTPDELRMIMVDPKGNEFTPYQDIPHLLLPVVSDPKHANTALKWTVREMERRYRILGKVSARNLAAFNQKIEEMGADVIHDLLFSEENQNESISTLTSAGTDWMEAFEPDESGAPKVGKLPYMVVIIDELADLMMTAKKEVEISIARLAQKARAAGIHLVAATQRPSTDVITGLIKANLPSRVSFQLASFVDSKTIIDRAGAERLLGSGDMLFIPPGINQTVRLHASFVDDEEITKITSYLKSQGKPAYREDILVEQDEDLSEEGDDRDGQDEMFDEAVELIKRAGHASASFLQRHLKIGYNRAARMIETMEERGIVGPADGARPRDVLVR